MGIDIGIDLGTSSFLIYVKGMGVTLCESSIVAKDKDTDEILAVGDDAYKMMGRTPGNIVAVRPLKEGVISDYEVTQRMMKFFVEKALGNKNWKRMFFRPTLVVCVPGGATEVEKRAARHAAESIGTRNVYLIEEPVAAALGAGIDIFKPCGNLIVDIGGGTSDIAVISMGGIVESSSSKVAGDRFDDAIIRYLRRKYNIMIGERMAELIKIKIGTVFEPDNTIAMDVRGRNTVTGLPMSVTVSASELFTSLCEIASMITDEICVVLEKIPPELSADISDRGVIMTGGGSQLTGFDKFISRRTGIKVFITDDPVTCVVKGTGVALNNPDILKQRE